MDATGGAPGTGGVAGGGAPGTGGVAGGGAPGTGGIPGLGGIGGAGPSCPGFGPTSNDPALALSPIGEDVSAYDGPALVERSADDGLILILSPPGAQTYGRVLITGLDSTQLFPAGARVWLTESQDSSGAFAFAVRDGQAGTLLIGAASQAYGALSIPVSTSQPIPECAVYIRMDCIMETVTYATTVVAGDTPITVASRQPSTFVLGGVTYDVKFEAQVTEANTCGRAGNGARIDVRAQDLATRAAQLPQGTLPACVEGNDPNRLIFFSFDALSPPWAAEVSYDGYSPSDGHEFEVVGGNPIDGYQFVRLGGDAQDVLAAPEVGAQFWASWESNELRALFESEGGPLVVARYDLGSASPGPLPQLEDLLGVGVTLEVSCAYDDSTDLYDVSFATEPSVRVASDSIATIAIGGRNYHVWLGASSITIYPAD
jgi:hypothetical protein